MYPLLELSGKRSLYIEEILYVYNIQNEINNTRIRFLQQQFSALEIRKKSKYKLKAKKRNF